MTEQLYIIMNNDHTQIMKGLSKSYRYMLDVDDSSQYISTFTTEDSAKVWLRKDLYIRADDGTLEIASLEWKEENLEIVKINVNCEVEHV